MARTSIVVLLTDFGYQDSYVAQMKGVLHSRIPGAQLEDLTHGVALGDVRAAAFHLEQTYAQFPPATVFLAVVDPGVGGARRALALRADNRYFVGPDNGLFGFLASSQVEQAVELKPAVMGLEPPCPTFHGRDLFAKAAARLASGTSILKLGEVTSPALVRLEIPLPRVEHGHARASVLLEDRFGNAITTLARDMTPPDATRISARCRDADFPLVRTYEEAAPGAFLCLWGSSNRLELAVRQGSAVEHLGIQRDDAVEVTWL